MLNRRQLFAGLLAGPLPLVGAKAQMAYPNKPIRLIVPFTPGGSTDVLGRAIGLEISRSLGQPVIVENVPGAGGSLGAERVARSAPDGYTLLMGHIGTLGVNPSLYPKLGYDPVKSFAPVAWIARVPNVLVVNPSVPARNLRELVDLVKARPNQLNFGSGGNGSAAHIATEFLKLQTGTQMQHVPYKGTAPAVNDLLAGQIQVLFTGAPAVLAHIRAGKLRAIAVSSPKRLSQLPEVPTVAESGIQGTSGFEADQWYGLVAPAGVPAPVIALLNQHVNRALTSEEVRSRLASEGAEAKPSAPQDFGQLIAREIPRWERVVKTARITVD